MAQNKDLPRSDLGNEGVGRISKFIMSPPDLSKGDSFNTPIGFFLHLNTKSKKYSIGLRVSHGSRHHGFLLAHKVKKRHRAVFYFVGEGRLELPHLAVLVPKTSAATITPLAQMVIRRIDISPVDSTVTRSVQYQLMCHVVTDIVYPVGNSKLTASVPSMEISIVRL